MGIVVIGACFVDVKAYPEKQFIPGGRNVGRVEYVHGGVGRNVAEDIANIELRPTFVSLVDKTGTGEDVIQKLRNHKVNTDYIRAVKNGMGTWVAVFDNDGDVIASVSQRPDLTAICDVLDECGDEIFRSCDSIAIEIDVDKEIVKKVFAFAQKYQKKVFALVSNMSIAIKRRDFIRETSCFICNIAEAGILFSEDYSGIPAEQMIEILQDKAKSAKIRRLIVTMGGEGAVYVDTVNGECGICPPVAVEVVDTTGAGDSFFAGVTIGMTYGKDMKAACRIGAKLAASVISTSESVCPRFLPSEIGLEME